MNILEEKPVTTGRMWKPVPARFWEKNRQRFLLGVLCLAGAVALGRVAVMAQALDPWRNFWIVFLFALFLLWAALATFMAKDRFAGLISSENIEAHLNVWLLKFRFANQKLPDSSGARFAYRITIPDGQVVIISRPASLDNYLRYRTDVTIPERHRRALNDMGENGRRRFMIEYLAECAKARVRITSARGLPLTVRIERTLPVSRDLSADDFWAGLEAIQQDVVIAVTHVDWCIERMSEAQDRRSTVIFPRSGSSATSEAASLTDEPTPPASPEPSIGRGAN